MRILAPLFWSILVLIPAGLSWDLKPSAEKYWLHKKSLSLAAAEASAGTATSSRTLDRSLLSDPIRTSASHLHPTVDNFYEHSAAAHLGEPFNDVHSTTSSSTTSTTADDLVYEPSYRVKSGGFSSSSAPPNFSVPPNWLSESDMQLEPRSAAAASASASAAAAVVQTRAPAGCAYKGRRYAHAEEVTTSQPCLNCTCQRGFVSCFLRVCPTLNAPLNDDSCFLLKEPGACCSTLKCQGPNHDESRHSPSWSPKNKHHGSDRYPSNSIERKAEGHRRYPPSPSHHGSTSRPAYWPTPSKTNPSTSSHSRPRSTARPRSPLATQTITGHGMHRPQSSSSSSSTSFRPSSSGSTSSASRFSTSRPSITSNRYPSRPQSASHVSTAGAHRIQPQRQPPRTDSDNEFFRLSPIMI